MKQMFNIWKLLIVWAVVILAACSSGGGGTDSSKTNTENSQSPVGVFYSPEDTKFVSMIGETGTSITISGTKDENGNLISPSTLSLSASNGSSAPESLVRDMTLSPTGQVTKINNIDGTSMIIEYQNNAVIITGNSSGNAPLGTVSVDLPAKQLSNGKALYRKVEKYNTAKTASLTSNSGIDGAVSVTCDGAAIDSPSINGAFYPTFQITNGSNLPTYPLTFEKIAGSTATYKYRIPSRPYVQSSQSLIDELRAHTQLICDANEILSNDTLQGKIEDVIKAKFGEIFANAYKGAAIGIQLSCATKDYVVANSNNFIKLDNLMQNITAEGDVSVNAAYHGEVSSTVTSHVTPALSSINTIDLKLPAEACVEVGFDRQNYTAKSIDGTAQITVKRNGPITDHPTYVTYNATAGTAVPGEDFNFAAGQIIIPANSSTGSFNVQILNSNKAGDKTVNLELLSATGAKLISPSTATLTINGGIDLVGNGNTTSTQFGGLPYCTYQVTMTNLQLKATVDNSGVVTNGILTGTMTESTVGDCPYSPIGTNNHTFTQESGNANGNSDGANVQLVLNGASNSPSDRASFSGTISNSRLSGTLTIYRTDLPGTNLNWVVTTTVN